MVAGGGDRCALTRLNLYRTHGRNRAQRATHMRPQSAQKQDQERDSFLIPLVPDPVRLACHLCPVHGHTHSKRMGGIQQSNHESNKHRRLFALCPYGRMATTG